MPTSSLVAPKASLSSVQKAAKSWINLKFQSIACSQEMEQAGSTNAYQVEIPGFYAEWLIGSVLPLHSRNVPGYAANFDTMVGRVPYDVKTHTLRTASGKARSPWVVANSKQHVDAALDAAGGIGFLVFEVNAVYAPSSSSIWENYRIYRRGISAASELNRSLGRTSRARKDEFTYVDFHAYVFSKQSFEEAKNYGIVKVMAQGHQADKKQTPRLPKYKVNFARLTPVTSFTKLSDVCR